MSSRHRFLQRSITHVSFHNRLTEEDVMWRRREHEREDGEKDNKKRLHRSRSPYEKQKRYSRKYRSSSSSNDERNSNNNNNNNNRTDAEFGPPLPSNLGINADQWDHAFFMQRYPDEYEKQINKPKRNDSTSSENKKKKKKHTKHHQHRRMEEDNKKKSKRRHRSRS
ncbi:unnamed protein product [Rotaria sp. Silwood2]|nr:unnamed protein product [Rotaria sp. Silwood2]CAF2518353.1 unnamed protein product [Rotaria sp. Silwood2]CAF2755534.1 unnamed protein product [Rotaria sp. Silwood2]CAF2915209.1 unnamed protein product [Rotaria sp. Silwood2]CAF3892217.1 unnamed protein product [Rotaria sp. Silwood2]